MRIKLNAALFRLLKRNAEKSPSTYRIGGIAISKRGDILGASFNAYRAENLPQSRGSGLHCEASLIKKYGPHISTIVIMRIGRGGEVRPIEPCKNCQKLADKYGIKIISIAT